MTTVDEETFRSTLANFPSGVVVVTSVDEDDEPVGLTASSFTSVSAEPPLISVCINRKSATLEAIRSRRGFTINMLSGHCNELATRFAAPVLNRFSGLSQIPTDEGGPILDEHVSAYLVCSLHTEIHAGTHSILVGLVREADVLHDNTLIYHNRRFFGCNSNAQATED